LPPGGSDFAQALISQGFANLDGKYPEASRDFIGQGVANLASGLFRGMPVGGSMSATALVVNAGARSSLANLTAGIVMAVVILLFGALVANVALPATAGLLMVIGVRTLKPDRIEMVWKTGLVQQTVMGITFVTSLLIPLQFAVLVGVALSLVLYVVQQSNRVTVKSWAMAESGELTEQDAPKTIPAGEVTMLTPYGSLFFATARLVEAELPEVTAATRHAVVIMNLRRESDLGSTFLGVLGRYADLLRANSSKLLGLEMLVAADVVRTVALEPTLSNVAALGLLGGIRTFLSWSLVVEIEHRWPWQRPGHSVAESAESRR
jgi:sulfate permease, SulP family